LSSSCDCPLGPFVTNTFGDRYLYPVNREAFNKVGAEALYRQRFGQNLDRENTLYVVVGLDSGLLLDFVRKQTIPRGSHFIFVELPEVLDRLGKERLLPGPEEPVTCLSGSEFLAQLQAMEFRNYFYLDRVQLWQSVAADDAHLTGYLELYWTVRDKLENQAWEVKSSLGTRAFMEKQLDNLPENRVSGQCLDGLFTGKTAVLLAGGPSLDAILPWVQSHRESLVVLSVSRIARRLQEVGLVPDLVFSIDPHPVSFDVSKEMLLWGGQTLLVNLYHVVPRLLGNWQGQSVFLGPRFPWQTPLNDRTARTSGPTVTNFALSAAVAMGFSQVVLAGVDLCFSRSGHTHARGSNESLAGPQFGMHDTRVETNAGWLAYTTNAMAQAIPILTAQASAARQQGCRFVNPAPGAARVEHVDHRSLEELALATLDQPAWQTIRQVLAEDSADERIRHYQTMLAELDRGRTRLNEIRKLCEKALQYNQALFGSKGVRPNFHWKKKLDRIEHTLNSDYRDFTQTIKSFSLQEFLKLSSPESSDHWSDEEAETIGRRYYEIYRESAAQLIRHIDGARRRLENRLQEEQPEAVLNALLPTWQQQEEPGRALLWSRRHPERLRRCSTEDRQRLEEMSAAFRTLITDRQTSHLAKRQADADPEIARKKALPLFRKQDVEALQDLLRGLECMEESTAGPIRHLVAGYVAELSGDAEEALAAYQAIVTAPPGSCTEEALRRVLSISLGRSDGENALLALECLAFLSPVYLPQYADLLKALGQTDKALGLYADYLEQIPDDLIVLVKVGKIYQDLGMTEEAATVFRYLQDKDPENRSYRSLVEQLESKARKEGCG
jgi:hypothetical protein